jgi:FMN phosphatase YigB (HAD superfamily)
MPCLLLDVDGVILRDSLLFAHVKHNASRYVEKKLPDCKHPASVNATLYLAHGHTARGLKNAFGIDASDYNKFVYDKSLMAHLNEVLEKETFQRDAGVIHDLTQKGWEVTLFSNAPYEWVRPVSLAINDTIKIRCPGPDLTMAHLKPDPAFYKEFDDCLGYYYVDDSLKNLGTVRNWPNWRPILFSESERDPRLWCRHVRSIPELSLTLANLWSP